MHFEDCFVVVVVVVIDGVVVVVVGCTVIVVVVVGGTVMVVVVVDVVGPVVVGFAVLDFDVLVVLECDELEDVRDDVLVLDVAVGGVPKTRVGCTEDVLVAVLVTELGADDVLAAADDDAADAATFSALFGRISAVEAAAGGTAIAAAEFACGLRIPAGIAVAASPRWFADAFAE